MAESQQKNSTEIESLCEYYMRSDIIDQSNIIHQSNMALSVYSVITQSYSSVKINNREVNERDDEDE